MDTNAQLPERGHNNPPTLLEEITAETEAIRRRSEELLASVAGASVSDRDTAEKATLLVGLLREHAGEIDKLRVKRKAPFLEACRTIDAYFGSLSEALIGSDAKGKLAGPAGRVKAMVDQFRRDEEARAAAERQRLLQEAEAARKRAEEAEREQREAERRRQEEAAAEAERVRAAEERALIDNNRAAAEAAQRARAAQEENRRKADEEAAKQRIAAELAQRQDQERAAALTQQAEAVKAAPINTGLGVKAFGRKVWVARITDWDAAIKHALTLNPAAIHEAVQKLYDAQVRAKVRSLPGAIVEETSDTTIRR